MKHEALEQGQDLYAVWSPPHGEYGETAGAKVGFGDTTAIKVGRLSGPMGWYDVAEVYEGEEVVAIHPLHFMDTIRAVPFPETENPF